MITPQYFLGSNLTLDKKTIEVKFSNFEVVGWKFTKFLMSYLKPQVSFSLNFASLFSVMRDTLYFCSWNFIWIGLKEPIKEQNFRLSTTKVKFHQIYTLICSFWWKYIKFQLKKYRGVMSHGTEESCKIQQKSDL